MRLPPVDTYREPLVQPLGHLVLHAAFLDNALLEFFAMLLPFGPDTATQQVAHRLRNWDQKFLNDAIDAAVPQPALVADLHSFVARLEDLRNRRHRMIHDAMEVGIEEEPEGSGRYRPILLRDGYQRVDKTSTTHLIERVTPEDIAALAYEFYEAGLEIDVFIGRLYDAGGMMPLETPR